MNIGSLRRALPWAVVFLAAGAAGCTCTRPTTTKLSPCPVKNKEHVVLLRAETKDDGKTWKAIAQPDFITIRGYDPDNPDTVVIWAYRFKSALIKFKDASIPPPVCDDGAGECKLQLPSGLKLLYKYKYTVRGEYDDKTHLDSNDPFIEVDR